MKDAGLMIKHVPDILKQRPYTAQPLPEDASDRGSIFGLRSSYNAGLPEEVLTWADAVFLLECPVKSGIVGEAHRAADSFQRLSLLNEGLGSNQPALGHTAVKTDAQLLPEHVTDGTLADIELPGDVSQGDFF